MPQVSRRAFDPGDVTLVEADVEQRGKIQEQLTFYENMKHDGSYPIIGVNTFRSSHGESVPAKLELIRSSGQEKQSQLKSLREFHKRHAKAAPEMLPRLRQAVVRNENVFAMLMDAVRVCSFSARLPTPCSRSGASTGEVCKVGLGPPYRPGGFAYSAVCPLEYSAQALMDIAYRRLRRKIMPRDRLRGVNLRAATAAAADLSRRRGQGLRGCF